MRGAKEEYLAAGMDDFVSKPIDAALLFDKLARLPRAARSAPSPLPGPALRGRCSPGSGRFRRGGDRVADGA